MRSEAVTLVVFLFIFLPKSTKTLPFGCEMHDEKVKNIRLRGVKCDTEAYLMEVPSNFPNYINYLDIENQPLENLTVSSFANYPQLQYLILKNNYIKLIEEKTFLSLTKLVHLDLSANFINELPPLPSSIEALSLNMMLIGPTFFESRQTTNNMLKLELSLKTLVINKNKLKFLPPFLKNMTSLSKICAVSNGIDELSVDDIAPLCNLEVLDFTGNRITSTERKVCNCQFVVKWALEHNVKIYNLTCPEISALDYFKCEAKFPQNRASQDRSRAQCRDTTWLQKHLFLCISGLIFFVVVVAGIYFWYWSRQERWRSISMYSTSGEENLGIPDVEIPLKEIEE